MIATKREWKGLGYQHWVLVAADGRILSEVSGAMGGGYHAHQGILPLGYFYDLESAKRAVEKRMEAWGE